jgi:alanine-synthesizing transaminase
MFSSRLDWSSPPNPLIDLRARRIVAGDPLIDLTESNPTVAGFDYAPLDLPGALANADVQVHRPSPQGDAGARAAVARYYAEHGHEVDPDSILLTASTSEAYSYLFSLLCDAGDEVLVPRPGYPLFDFLAALESVRPVAYPLRLREHWRLHLDHLEASVSTRTRAIVVVSPHNPTGHCLDDAEREAVVALCARHELALIVDEVFLDHVDAPRSGSVGTMVGEARVLTFVLSGLSKVVAVPQVKLGWIHVGGPESLARGAMRRLEFVADTYLSVSGAAQLATDPLLARRHTMRDGIAARVAGNLTALRHACALHTGAAVLPREGGWYALVRLQGVDAARFALRLLEHDGVFVHPGYFYDLDDEGIVVLSLLTPTEVFDEGIVRMLTRARRDFIGDATASP